jgi:phosphoribosylaminoimidazolecarboxamide formyltransferase/IMP cyclohydrolase
VKRALISVYEKAGLIDFARELINNDFEIVSTSGTAKILEENGIKIKTVEELTKSPEVLNGRVKTLHPLVFAGILADKNNSDHLKQVKEFGFDLFDLVIVGLYPFSETIKKEDCTITEAIEQIDIGGVSLIRAAAKNYGSVSVLVNPDQYKRYIDNITSISDDFNLKLASEAFEYIAKYDEDISKYFRKLSGQIENQDEITLHFVLGRDLRYGENPHQKAKLYQSKENSFNEIFDRLHGKDLSYINILDIDAAYNLINEFDDLTCAIIKHTNPSGVASDKNIIQAYLKALACDNVSRFGGIIIVNRTLDLNTAQEIDKIKTDILIAPEYNSDALEFLKKKKNRVLISYKQQINSRNQLNIKSVNGGVLIQDNDAIIVNESEMKCVTERKPAVDEVKDLMFAMKVAKHTKSNSVVYAKNLQTVGIGGGQPSRVDSSRIAVEKARRFGMDLAGSAVASDAFFPFADGLIEAAKAGAKSVIEPGGSIKDNEVIQAANDNGLAMIFTGIRHFRH